MTKRQAYIAGRAAYRRAASFCTCYYRDPEHVREWERGWIYEQNLRRTRSQKPRPRLDMNAQK